MAFGFGFNKTRSLAAAEKYVQQGKLQNAISEYEKIAREDPRDIAVVNTVGDLYSRLGQNEKAVACFRRVGDQYASEGYTLKAIAMYKKLAKLGPDDRENLQKLADLYTQQGLYNEARSQYMNLAEQHLRANESAQAIRIFQKMLDVDPENVNVQGKLADLLSRVGKPEDAKAIYVKAARVQRAKGAKDAARATVQKLLALDRDFPDGLLLHGLLLADDGHDSEAAVALERVPNIDSVREGLTALLQAWLNTGDVQNAAPVARKLFAIHHDVSGLARYAEALLQKGKFRPALEVYDQNVADFLSHDPAGLLNSLQSAISLIKDDAPALEILRGIYRKAGENTFNNEVLELLAHAYVQEGRMDKAAELYRELSIAEPDNPLHAQNYRQIVARLGNDPIYRAPGAGESTQAFMIEQLEVNAKAVPQQHPPEIHSLIRSALTDSELFASYNMPEKAIAPLENALPDAPQDIQVNQRLAVLYARTKRFQQAAERCTVLSEVYAAAGHPQESQQYAELAHQYSTTPEMVEPPAPEVSVGDETMPQFQEVPASAAVGEFIIEPAAPTEFEISASRPETQAEGSVTEFEFEVVPSGAEEQVAPAQPGFAAESGSPEAAVVPEQSAIHEIDLSGEWEELAQGGDILEPIVAPVDFVEPPDLELELSPAPEAPLGSAEAVAVPSAQDSVPDAAVPAAYWEEMHPAPQEVQESMSSAAPSEPLSPVSEIPETAASASFSEEHLPEGDLLEVSGLAAADDISLQLEVPFEPAPQKPAPAASVEVGAEPVTVNGSASEAPEAAAGLLGDLAEEVGSALDGMAMPQPASTAPKSGPTPVSPVPLQAMAQTQQPAEGVPAQPAAAKQPPAQSADLLSDLFSEFKEEVEDQTASEKDLDTHYNLGVAFREMGLLDEAIGELQAVCNSIDRGTQFDQTIQAYTWLAQCLVDKGVPEAAVRWYERALKIPRIDPDSMMAIYYDLASAYEKAGNEKAAAENFMHVYSMNIDYRDVAERVKSYKARVEQG